MRIMGHFKKRGANWEKEVRGEKGNQKDNDIGVINTHYMHVCKCHNEIHYV